MSQPNDASKKSPRTFQCRDQLWETFEQMARELECSIDYLINEAMKQYARQRSYGAGAGAGATRRSFGATIGSGLTIIGCGSIAIGRGFCATHGMVRREPCEERATIRYPRRCSGL